MNPLRTFMVTGYALTGVGLCALAAVIPNVVTQITLAIGAALCFWRTHYWYRHG